MAAREGGGGCLLSSNKALFHNLCPSTRPIAFHSRTLFILSIPLPHSATFTPNACRTEFVQCDYASLFKPSLARPIK